MPLVVPALRLFIVFLNVYETFKTLKLPPLKRDGHPSVRSLTQRKRDLKGCLAIWIVWCCYAAYERTFDRVFSFLVPFHSEMKSVLLLFLLVTRAKGAEPLYLHVIRPFIKPYSVIVDPSLDVARDLGDFVFALLQVPMDYIQSVWWSLTWHTGELDATHSDLSSGTHTGQHESVIPARSSNDAYISTLAKHSGAIQTSRRSQVKRLASTRNVSDSKRRSSKNQPPINLASGELSARECHSKLAPTTTVPRYNTHLPLQESPQYSQTLPRNSRHQLWYPPVPVYGSDALGQPSGVITASKHGLARTVSYNPRSVREYQSEEWRSYPAFPSAYPPTPSPASAPLPSPVARSRSDSHYPPIPEDSSSIPDFRVSLEPQPELNHPSSVRGSSEGCGNFSGVYNHRGLAEPASELADESSDVGSQSGLSEHSHMGEDSDVDHDATLRTPYRFTYPNGMDCSTSSSSLSWASRSTTLTTADNASLITRTSSESLYSSDSSFTPNNRTLHPRSRNATLRGRPLSAQVSRDPFQSTADEDSEDSADSGIGVRPQKVLVPAKRTTHLRPVARATDTSRKNPVRVKATPVPAKTITATSRVRSSGRPASSNVSTIRGARGTTGSRRGQQGEAEFGATNGTAPSQAKIVRGKAT